MKNGLRNLKKKIFHVLVMISKDKWVQLLFIEHLAKLCNDRGTKIEKTYQINVGGNTDFLNMKEQDRLVSKKISKTESVQSQLNERLDDDQIYVGPSDFIPFLREIQNSCL